LNFSEERKLPMIAVQWKPTSKLAFVLSNRSKSGDNDVQLAAEFKLKRYTLTNALCRQQDANKMECILGLGGYFSGFELFSAYDVNENEFRFTVSFAPERMRDVIEVQHIEISEQILYPYRCKHNNPALLIKIDVKNKIDKPVELTVKLTGRDLPLFSKSLTIKEGFHSTIGIPIPHDLANVLAGNHHYNVDILAYRRGKQIIHRTLSFEMKDKHDWCGDPKDLVYFLTPDDKQIFTESRRIISRYSKSKNPEDALQIAEHIYNFIRYSINYIHDPKPLHQKQDRVQYPVETLHSGSGDCEDLAILMISLLQSVGIEAAFAEFNSPRSEDGHVFILFDSRRNISQILAKDENLQNFIIRNYNSRESKCYIPLELTRPELTFEGSWDYAISMYNEYAIAQEGLVNGWFHIIDAR